MKCMTSHELANYLLSQEDKPLGVGSFSHCCGEVAFYVSKGVIVYDKGGYYSIEDDLDEDEYLEEGEWS